MNENERRELRALGSNIRDDRTRLLIFKALDALELEQPPKNEFQIAAEMMDAPGAPQFETEEKKIEAVDELAGKLRTSRRK
jgi:hypothetical protein